MKFWSAPIFYFNIFLPYFYYLWYSMIFHTKYLQKIGFIPFVNLISSS